MTPLAKAALAGALGLAVAPLAALIRSARAGDGLAPVAVGIDNFTYQSAEITVAPGTRVVWTNRDDIPHTVTADDQPPGFHSPPLDSGDSFARVFTRAGIYHYFCSLHPRMRGTVVVR